MFKEFEATRGQTKSNRCLYGRPCQPCWHSSVHPTVIFWAHSDVLALHYVPPTHVLQRASAALCTVFIYRSSASAPTLGTVLSFCFPDLALDFLIDHLQVPLTLTERISSNAQMTAEKDEVQRG